MTNGEDDKTKPPGPVVGATNPEGSTEKAEPVGGSDGTDPTKASPAVANEVITGLNAAVTDERAAREKAEAEVARLAEELQAREGTYSRAVVANAEYATLNDELEKEIAAAKANRDSHGARDSEINAWKGKLALSESNRKWEWRFWVVIVIILSIALLYKSCTGDAKLDRCEADLKKPCPSSGSSDVNPADLTVVITGMLVVVSQENPVMDKRLVEYQIKDRDGKVVGTGQTPVTYSFEHLHGSMGIGTATVTVWNNKWRELSWGSQDPSSNLDNICSADKVRFECKPEPKPTAVPKTSHKPKKKRSDGATTTVREKDPPPPVTNAGGGIGIGGAADERVEDSPPAPDLPDEPPVRGVSPEEAKRYKKCGDPNMTHAEQSQCCRDESMSLIQGVEDPLLRAQIAIPKFGNCMRFSNAIKNNATSP
jgi:uncharacterized coiled-coil protein SlyX